MPQTYIRATGPGSVRRVVPDDVSYSFSGCGVPGTWGTWTDDQGCMLSTLAAGPNPTLPPSTSLASHPATQDVFRDGVLIGYRSQSREESDSFPWTVPHAREGFQPTVALQTPKQPLVLRKNGRTFESVRTRQEIRRDS